jgi:hypothetical protein
MVGQPSAARRADDLIYPDDDKLNRPANGIQGMFCFQPSQP